MGRQSSLAHNQRMPSRERGGSEFCSRASQRERTARRAFRRRAPENRVARPAHCPHRTFLRAAEDGVMSAKRILLIEDERDVANMLTLALRSGDYEVEFAHTAEQARACLGTGRY